MYNLCRHNLCLYFLIIINCSNSINNCQAIFAIFHFDYISYRIYFIEVILNSYCQTFINTIRIVPSRGSPKPTNVSCSCFLNEKLSNQILLQREELSSFSLWPLNFCYTTILFTATVSVRISSEDFNHAEASGSIPIRCFCCFFYERGVAKYYVPEYRVN